MKIKQTLSGLTHWTAATLRALLASLFVLIPIGGVAQDPQTDTTTLPLILLDKLAPAGGLASDPNAATDLTPQELIEFEAKQEIRKQKIAELAAAEAAGLCDGPHPEVPAICLERIVTYSLNGFEIPREAAPFQVQFLVNEAGATRERLASLLPDIPEWEARHACGGAVIAPGWALTAAHCFAIPEGEDGWVTDKSKYSIRLDVENIATDDSAALPIQEIIMHDQYSIQTNQNDLALVRYEGSRAVSNPYMPWYEGVLETERDRILHAQFRGPNIEIFAADNKSYILNPTTRTLSRLDNSLRNMGTGPTAPFYLRASGGRLETIPHGGGDGQPVGRTRLEVPVINLNPIGSYAVLIGQSGKGEVWDMTRRNRKAKFETDIKFRTASVVFSADNQTFLLTSLSGESELRTIRNGDLKVEINHSLPIMFTRAGPDNMAILEGALGTVELVDLSDGQVLDRFYHGGGRVKTDVQGHHLLTWSQEGRIRIFDRQSGQETFHSLFPAQPASISDQTQLLSNPDDAVRVQRIKMSRDDPAASAQTPLIAYGWGKTRATSQELSSAVLRKLSLKRLDWGPCNQIRGLSDAATDPSGFCVIGSGRKTCRGDSGGPLIEQNRLVGIVSRGSGLCWADDRPTIFASVAKAQGWIRDAVCSPGRAQWRDPVLCDSVMSD